MRTRIAISVAVVVGISSLALWTVEVSGPIAMAAPVLAGGNLPAACSNLEAFKQRPGIWDCPTPYVEMKPPPEGDVAYDRVWLCSTTKAVIGMVKPSMGLDPGICSGTGMKGWKLPDDALSLGVPLAVTSSGWTVPTNPYFALRSEVHHAVIMPCLRDAIDDAGAVPRGWTLDEVTARVYLETKHVLAPLAANAVNHTKGMDATVHAEFFALARDLCYEAVVDALF